MSKAIELLQEYWKDNADEIEYMDVKNPQLDSILTENEELQNAIKILEDSERADMPNVIANYAKSYHLKQLEGITEGYIDNLFDIDTDFTCYQNVLKNGAKQLKQTLINKAKN